MPQEMAKMIEENDLMDVDERPISPEAEVEAKYMIAGNFFPEHTKVRGAATMSKAVVKSKICTIS